MIHEFLFYLLLVVGTFITIKECIEISLIFIKFVLTFYTFVLAIETVYTIVLGLLVEIYVPSFKNIAERNITTV